MEGHIILPFFHETTLVVRHFAFMDYTIKAPTSAKIA